MRLDIAKSGSTVKSWDMGFQWAYNRGVYTRVYNRGGFRSVGSYSRYTGKTFDNCFNTNRFGIDKER